MEFSCRMWVILRRRSARTLFSLAWNIFPTWAQSLASCNVSCSQAAFLASSLKALSFESCSLHRRIRLTRLYLDRLQVVMPQNSFMQLKARIPCQKACIHFIQEVPAGRQNFSGFKVSVKLYQQNKANFYRLKNG